MSSSLVYCEILREEGTLYSSLVEGNFPAVQFWESSPLYTNFLL